MTHSEDLDYYGQRSFVDRMFDSIEALDIEPFQKQLLRDVFVHDVCRFSHDKRFYRRLSYPMLAIKNIGSIILASLLPVAKFVGGDNGIWFWFPVIISLVVALAANIMDMFNINEMYHKNAIISELMRMEGWAYVSLSGNYRHFDDHRTSFEFFFSQIDKHKQRFMAERYMNGQSGAHELDSIRWTPDAASVERMTARGMRRSFSGVRLDGMEHGVGSVPVMGNPTLSPM